MLPSIEAHSAAGLRVVPEEDKTPGVENGLMRSDLIYARYALSYRWLCLMTWLRECRRGVPPENRARRKRLRDSLGALPHAGSRPKRAPDHS